MAEQDPNSGGFNYLTGKHHSSSEKILAGVNSNDSEYSAAQKLNDYNKPNSPTTNNSGGIGVLIVYGFVWFYEALKHSTYYFKKSTGVNPFVYFIVASCLFFSFVHYTGGPRTYIQAISSSDYGDRFYKQGYLSFMTPDIDFFGYPKNIPAKSFSPKLAQIYSGILTESEITSIPSRSYFGDPTISQLRDLASKKGMKKQFDERTINYLNQTFRQSPDYKNANFTMEVKTPMNSYAMDDKTKPERIEIVIYSLEQK